MTKKDYVKAAEIANSAKTPRERQVLIQGFLELFANDKPKFDKERFKNACVK